jgi:hypothetical protein
MSDEYAQRYVPSITRRASPVRARRNVSTLTGSTYSSYMCFEVDTRLPIDSRHRFGGFLRTRRDSLSCPTVHGLAENF